MAWVNNWVLSTKLIVPFSLDYIKHAADNFSPFFSLCVDEEEEEEADDDDDRSAQRATGTLRLQNIIASGTCSGIFCYPRVYLRRCHRYLIISSGVFFTSSSSLVTSSPPPDPYNMISLLNTMMTVVAVTLWWSWPVFNPDSSCCCLR